MGFIYCIKDKISEKRYIGQTIHFVKQRFNGHKRKINRGKTPFYYTMQKRPDDFYIEWIGEYSNCELNYWEQYFISLCNTIFPNGYNMTIGGNAGGAFCETTREKIRQTKLGKKHSIESRAKMSKMHLGKKHSTEHIENNRLAHLGKKQTPEHIENNRKTKLGKIPWNKGKKASVESIEKNRIAQKKLGKQLVMILILVKKILFLIKNILLKQLKKID